MEKKIYVLIISNFLGENIYLGNKVYCYQSYDDAYTSFSTACRMEPNNMEYRAMFERLNKQRMGGFGNYGGYNTTGYGGTTGGCTTCDLCQGLICADCCCECMGGDLISCC